MVCQRCGWCCYGIPANLPRGDTKMGMEMCPYLGWEGPKSVCSIYGQPTMDEWKTTPCGKYQIHYDDDAFVAVRPCKMGFWIQQQGGLLQFISDKPDISTNYHKTIESLYAIYPRRGSPKQTKVRPIYKIRNIAKPIL